MRYFLTLLIISFGYCSVLSQTTHQPADTFELSALMSYKQLVIRSDSTYMYRETGCIHSILYMGFWTKTKDTLQLNGLCYSSVLAKSIDFSENDLDDSSITFEVHDCYGNPIPKYSLNFYDKDLAFDPATMLDYRTNEKGMLKINRYKFSMYSTESDENNQIDPSNFPNDLIYRPIYKSAKGIKITISFPKQYISGDLKDNFYIFNARQFIKTSTGLLDTQTGKVYQKK